MPIRLGWIVAIAGLVAVFATYWDEAWHTDIGRDSAWAAPHLLLYGSVGVVGLSVLWWGLRVLGGTRSLRATLAHPPLLAAGAGALGALVAAPIDAAWHQAYGRDAVLFSPPHMLVVLASTGLVLGVLTGLPPHARGVRTLVGILMLANAAAVVFEYEADVPQFSEIYYLPLLLTVGLTAVWLVRRVVPVRFPATTIVLGYVALRLLVAGGLLALGRSTPDLPIAVLGLCALDLPLRHATIRIAAALVATSTLAWAASAASLASPTASDVSVVAIPAIIIGGLVLLVRPRPRGLAARALLLALAALGVVNAERAEAHDPGQGVPVTRVHLEARTDVSGRVLLTATPIDHSQRLEPKAVVARRAGDEIWAALRGAREGTYTSDLTLPARGRWFVYAVFAHPGGQVEAWVPVEAGTAGTVAESRELYLPAGAGPTFTNAQVVTGGLVYALGFGLLALGIRAARASRPDTKGP